MGTIPAVDRVSHSAVQPVGGRPTQRRSAHPCSCPHRAGVNRLILGAAGTLAAQARAVLAAPNVSQGCRGALGPPLQHARPKALCRERTGGRACTDGALVLSNHP
jgi:hypothetical protein